MKKDNSAVFLLIGFIFLSVSNQVKILRNDVTNVAQTAQTIEK